MHHREQLVRQAESALLTEWVRICREKGLTTGEELRVLSAFAHEGVGGIAKYMIREERHGDTSKPGGVE